MSLVISSSISLKISLVILWLKDGLKGQAASQEDSYVS